MERKAAVKLGSSCCDCVVVVVVVVMDDEPSSSLPLVLLLILRRCGRGSMGLVVLTISIGSSPTNVCCWISKAES